MTHPNLTLNSVKPIIPIQFPHLTHPAFKLGYPLLLTAISMFILGAVIISFYLHLRKLADNVTSTPEAPGEEIVPLHQIQTN